MPTYQDIYLEYKALAERIRAELPLASGLLYGAACGLYDIYNHEVDVNSEKRSQQVVLDTAKECETAQKIQLDETVSDRQAFVHNRDKVEVMRSALQSAANICNNIFPRLPGFQYHTDDPAVRIFIRFRNRFDQVLRGEEVEEVAGAT